MGGSGQDEIRRHPGDGNDRLVLEDVPPNNVLVILDDGTKLTVTEAGMSLKGLSGTITIGTGPGMETIKFSNLGSLRFDGFEYVTGR
jgi:hypothetical protein